MNHVVLRKSSGSTGLNNPVTTFQILKHNLSIQWGFACLIWVIESIFGVFHVIGRDLGIMSYLLGVICPVFPFLVTCDCDDKGGEGHILTCPRMRK